MDHLDKIKMKDPDDVIAYKKFVERLCVHIFLNGLDAKFGQIPREILIKDPTLDLEETYAYICCDFVQRKTLNGESPSLEPFAMIARQAKSHQINQKQD